MAIVQISKIQHRRGLSDNLPQLASAELGWAINNRKLYIGNGTLSEGAPAIGNTEILTQYSDILGLISSYTYKGEHAGYQVQNSVARSLQEKLDERVSVLDFGATGDGSTDDTTAIQNAIYQLFIRENNFETRRTLYFPAGKYKLSSTITIPPYSIFEGDGPDSTELIQTSSDADCVARTADSLNQIYPSIGSNSADGPNHIIVKGMNFVQNTDNIVVQIDSAYDIRFENVKFIGPDESVTGIDDAGTEKSCIFMTSTPAQDTHTVIFDQCEFEAHTYGIKIDDDVNHVVCDKCTFTNLYKAVILGKDTTGSGNSVVGPRAVKVMASYFDNIYFTAFHAYSVSENISSYNTYRECANGLNGATNSIAPVIEFESDDNYSIGDNFDRSDADDATHARIEFNRNSCYAVEGNNWVKHGISKIHPGKEVTLTDNTTNGTVSGISLNPSNGESATIEYTIVRGTTKRRGMLLISLDESNADLSDDFVDNNGDVGVEFSVNIASATSVELLYTTTSNGSDSTFKYQLKYLG